MKLLNTFVTVLALVTVTACATQKSNSSAVASSDDAAPKKLIDCKRDGAHGAFTGFSITADADEQGPFYDKAQGKLVVSGGIAHFISYRYFQCTNRLAQPHFIGPDGPVSYDWSCQSLALDGSGDVATASDEMETVSIVTAQGQTTADLGAGLGEGKMICK